MRTARKLVLKKETLSELTSAEMKGVVGGTGTVISNAIQPCPTRNFPDPVCDRVSVMIQPCPSRDIC